MTATEQDYLEDNIATVAFHLGRPSARLSVTNDLCGLVVDSGEVLKEVSRRLVPAQQTPDTLEVLLELYQWCCDLNDFRPDSRLGRKVKAALYGSDGPALPSTESGSEK